MESRIKVGVGAPAVGAGRGCVAFDPSRQTELACVMASTRMWPSAGKIALRRCDAAAAVGRVNVLHAGPRRSRCSAANRASVERKAGDAEDRPPPFSLLVGARIGRRSAR